MLCKYPIVQRHVFWVPQGRCRGFLQKAGGETARVPGAESTAPPFPNHDARHAKWGPARLYGSTQRVSRGGGYGV